MDELTEERLYDLLPAVYRQHDADEGGVLRTLVAIVDRERERLEDDVEALYENQFIETCEPWVVPYVADLLDLELPSTTWSLRSYVANTLAYRRRKGTLAAIESLAADVSGWPASAVEFFRRLSTKQHTNRPRPDGPGWADIRAAGELEKIGGPFDPTPRSVDVRRIEPRRGRYNIPNIGVFVWPVRSFPLSGVRPLSLGDLEIPASDLPFGHGVTAEMFQLHPAGVDVPMYNRPRTEESIEELAEEEHVPTALRRRVLHDELSRIRDSSGDLGDAVYFDYEEPVFQIEDLGKGERVPATQFYICDLGGEHWGDASNFEIPFPFEFYGEDGSVTTVDPETGDWDVYLLDPTRARMVALARADHAAEVRTDYSYGALGELGGGPYSRRDSAGRRLEESQPDWQMGVQREPVESGPDANVVGSIEKAVEEWNDAVDVRGRDEPFVGVIAVMDSDTYPILDSPLEVHAPPNHQLFIVGAEWPAFSQKGASGPRRIPGLVEPNGVRPHVRGDLKVAVPGGLTSGTAADADAGEVVLNGLLWEGGVTIEQGAVDTVRLAHTSLVPEAAEGDSASIEASVAGGGPAYDATLRVEIDHCIAGRLDFEDVRAELDVADSVVGAWPEGEVTDWAAVAASNVRADIERSTLFGRVDLERLEADDTIFEGRVVVDRRQEGCVRFSYARRDSELPRTYRCQPFQAIDDARTPGATLTEEERTEIAQQNEPHLASRRWWNTALAYLRRSTPDSIRRGAEDGGEMGVWGALEQPEREASLRRVLDEQLRVGMHAGIFVMI